MRRSSLSWVVAGVIFAGALGSPGAYGGQNGDVDLFLQAPVVNSAYPNVMILMDAAGANNGSISNTCSATQKKISMEQCIMSGMLTGGLVPNTVNMGLAAYNPSTAPVNGGYIAAAVRNMTTTNASTLATAINQVQTVNSSYYGLLLDETYRYYRGIAPYAGTSMKSNMTAYWDPTAVSGSNYVSPVTDKCQRNFIIFIGNGGPSSTEDSNGSSPNQLSSFGGSLAEITISPNNYQSSYADQWTRFLKQTDMFTSMANQQNIVTYTIGVFDPSETQPSAMAARALLKSMAAQGGGKYFEASSSSAMQQILHDILLEIQSINSVFASVALPVSVNVRGTYLNQVYIGMFRPDANALPRWYGNLKEYQIGWDSATSSIYLADSTGALASDSSGGFITNTAISYWTTDSTFWSFSPNTTSNNSGASDSADGKTVERGAEAEWLRNTYASSQTARKLYTCTGSCTSGSALSSTPFDTSNNSITQANTGTTSSTDLSNLINWVRGQDLYDENINSVTTDVRASIHGDVLHARPAVINYNRYSDNNDVFIFYGGNDGIFHAIQGGQLTSGSRAGGTEQWGFIPSEFFGQLKQLRDNNVDVLTTPKPSFVDGPVGVYQLDANNNGILRPSDSDVVQLYLGMHRGGRLLYSLDATDPASPKFKWKKTNSNTGYSELGQTWSTAQPVKVRAFTNPVLVMGGGYDSTAEDAMPQGTASMGRGIFVIDAITGQVLWQAGSNPSGATTNVTVSGMTFDIPADLMVLDRDNDGLADRIYATDTGANIWRVDMDDADPSNWTVTQIASLRGADTASDKRKFLFRVDVVYGDSAGGAQPYDALMVGSGDREHPFDTTITNRFYMIKDPSLGKTVNAGFTTITEANLYDATADLIQTGTSSQVTAAKAALNSASGWYITLGAGEKVVGNSVTQFGTTTFATNQPDTSGSSCSNLGIARTYKVSFLDATATTDQDGVAGMSASDRSGTVAGGGFLPSPVPVTTILNGQPVTGVCFGANCGSLGNVSLGTRYKTYWHTNRDK